MPYLQNSYPAVVEIHLLNSKTPNKEQERSTKISVEKKYHNFSMDIKSDGIDRN